MTTQAEIKKWVRPFIERYPTTIQAGHMLVFRPLGHMMRALAFFGGSSRYNLNPNWMLCPLVLPPGLMNMFGNEIPVGYTNWPGFQETFYERTFRAIEWYLLPNTTIQHFCDLGWQQRMFFQGTLRNFPIEHAVLLAALVQFAEAEAMLIAPLAELELRATAYLEQGRAQLAKRASSRAGQFDLEMGEATRTLADELGRLLKCLRERDAAAIATLLREWELRNVTAWKVDHLWQPTPFPFEA